MASRYLVHHEKYTFQWFSVGIVICTFFSQVMMRKLDWVGWRIANSCSQGRCCRKWTWYEPICAVDFKQLFYLFAATYRTKWSTSVVYDRCWKKWRKIPFANQIEIISGFSQKMAFYTSSNLWLKDRITDLDKILFRRINPSWNCPFW